MDRRDEGRSRQQARRALRRDRPSVGPEPVGCDRRDRDRRPGRRHLRQGRRRGARRGDRAPGRRQVLGAQEGQAGLEGLPLGRRPRGARHRPARGFPYRTPPKGKAKGHGDAGSRARSSRSRSSPRGRTRDPPAGSRSRGAARRPRADRRRLERAASSRRASPRAGNPIAVFGPQTGYFAPQLLMEQDAHAPGGPEGPAIDARGVAFVGTNLYVQLGRGQDYSWSATSAGQDIIDTFAVKLCDPDGSEPDAASTSYVFNGQCMPMDVLEHTNTLDAERRRRHAARLARRCASTGPRSGWSTATGDDQGQALRVHQAARDLLPRGRLGRLVRRLEQPRGRPRREVLDEGRLHGRPDLQLVLHRRRRDRLLQLGRQPGARQGHPPELPGARQAAVPVEELQPRAATRSSASRFKRHAQVIDQRFLTSWNNKQAPGYRCDGIRCYTPVYRSDPLDDEDRGRDRGQAGR